MRRPPPLVGGPGTRCLGHGHAAIATGYDKDGLQVVTWGTVVSMSWEFARKYTQSPVIGRERIEGDVGVTPVTADAGVLPELEGRPHVDAGV